MHAGRCSSLLRAFALASAVAGCSGSTPPPPVVAPAEDFVEGDRLKVPYWRTDDGYLHWDGGELYDSLRREACVFAHTTDGKTRCMPLYRAAEELFADPGCQDPLRRWDKGSTNRYFVTADRTIPCDPRFDFREAGAPYVEPQLFHIFRSVCTPVNPDPLSEYTREGPSLALDDFVEAAEAVVPRGQSLSEMHLRAADGLTVRTGLFDPASQLPCTPQFVSNSVRCLPEARYTIDGTGSFVDATCTGARVAHEWECSEGRTDWAVEVSPFQQPSFSQFNEFGAAACLPVVKVFQTGAPWQGTPFAKDLAGCIPGRKDVAPYVEVGAEQDLSGLPPLMLATDAARKVNRPYYVDDTHGATLPLWSRRAYDGRLHEMVDLAPAPDGGFYFLPPLGAVKFTDPGCSLAIAVSARTDNACGSKQRYVMIDGQLRQVNFTVPMPPPRLYGLDRDGACVETGSVESILVAYSLGVIGDEAIEPVRATKVTF